MTRFITIFCLLLVGTLANGGWKVSKEEDFGGSYLVSTTLDKNIYGKIYILPSNCVVEPDGSASYPIVILVKDNRNSPSVKYPYSDFSIDSIPMAQAEAFSHDVRSSSRVQRTRMLPPFESFFKKGSELLISTRNSLVSSKVSLKGSFASYSRLSRLCKNDWRNIHVVRSQIRLERMNSEIAEEILGPSSVYRWSMVEFQGKPHRLIYKRGNPVVTINPNDLSSANDNGFYASCDKIVYFNYVTAEGFGLEQSVIKNSILMDDSGNEVGKFSYTSDGGGVFNNFYWLTNLKEAINGKKLSICERSSKNCLKDFGLAGFNEALKPLYRECKTREVEINLKTAVDTILNLQRHYLAGDSEEQIQEAREAERYIRKYASRPLPDLLEVANNMVTFKRREFFHPEIGSFTLDECPKAQYSDNASLEKYTAYCNQVVAKQAAEYGFTWASRSRANNAKDAQITYNGLTSGNIFSGIVKGIASAAVSHYSGDLGISPEVINSAVNEVLPAEYTLSTPGGIRNSFAPDSASSSGNSRSTENFIGKQQYSCTRAEQQQMADYMKQANNKSAKTHGGCAVLKDLVTSLENILPYMRQCDQQNYNSVVQQINGTKPRRDEECAMKVQ